MRLRSVVAATAAAFALALSLPTAASAAEGDFFYTYTGVDGAPLRGVLSNPPSGMCVNLPESAAPYVPPAHSTRNGTDSRATVFSGPDCTGDAYTHQPVFGYGSEDLRVRSVYFV